MAFIAINNGQDLDARVDHSALRMEELWRSCGASELSAIAVKGGHLCRKARVLSGHRRLPAPSLGRWAAGAAGA